MSVQYKLNKIVTIGDLRKVGFTIEDYREKIDGHPFVASNENGRGIAISKVITNNDNNIDNWEINEFEGRFSHGGADVMLEICDKLDCKFITDEDVETLIREDKHVITDEMFENRTNEFRKLLEEYNNK